MVIQALPVIKAITAAQKKTRNKKQETKIVWLTPSGKQFDNKVAARMGKNYKHLIIVCGRYEGIDARVKKVFKVDEISVGPFVLTGGELPAMVIMDAVSRQVKGVLGNYDSLEERRVAGRDVFTRPEEFKYKKKAYKVPKILLSGHKAKIEEWKKSGQKSGQKGD
jgi:tRNA (guanine37-N1)-methyltransferase